MIDRTRLLRTFLELARIPSPSGSEAEVANAITQRMELWGLDVEHDEVGNLLARVTGEGDPLVITAHMDTVGPCDKVIPLVRDEVIHSDGTSILGADDKAGVAIILEALAVLLEDGLPHRPLEVLFTVREETGLEGARALDVNRLHARMAIGLDAGGPQGTIVASAPSQDSLWAQIRGRAAHAGVDPENGINAIRVAAEAIAAMPLGRIDPETTANIGVISGGRATNIIPDTVTIKGEARSRNQSKLVAQTQAMVQALERSATGHGATVDLRVTRMYDGYTLDERVSVIRLVSQAMRRLGIEPLLIPSGGGSDANVLNAAGVQMVQISAGMAAVHTLEEHVALADMVASTRIILACVSS